MQYLYWLIIVTRPCDQLTFLPNGDLTLLLRRKHDFYILLSFVHKTERVSLLTAVKHSRRARFFEILWIFWSPSPWLHSNDCCQHSSKKEREHERSCWAVVWVQCSVLFVSTSCAFNDVCFGNIYCSVEFLLAIFLAEFSFFAKFCNVYNKNKQAVRKKNCPQQILRLEWQLTFLQLSHTQ